MSKLFETLADQTRGLPEAEQDRIARLILAEMQLIELRRQMRGDGIPSDITREGTIVF